MSDEMCQFQSTNCGYIYDPGKGNKDRGIPPGTSFEYLPDDWKCPLCGASRKLFKKLL